MADLEQDLEQDDASYYAEQDWAREQDDVCAFLAWSMDLDHEQAMREDLEREALRDEVDLVLLVPAQGSIRAYAMGKGRRERR